MRATYCSWLGGSGSGTVFTDSSFAPRKGLLEGMQRVASVKVINKQTDEVDTRFASHCFYSIDDRRMNSKDVGKVQFLKT